MKSKFFRFCLLACIPLLSVACSSSEKLSGNEFLIEGEISDVKDGVVIQLGRMDGDMGSRIASDTLVNGRFIFKEDAISDMERLYIIIIDEGFPPMMLNFWATPGAKIKIKGKGKLFPAWEVKSPVAYQKEENLYANKSRDIIAEYSRIAVEFDDMHKMARKVSSDEARTYRNAADSLNLMINALMIKRLFADMDVMEKTDISPIWLNKMKELSLTLSYSDEVNEHYGRLRKNAEALYGRMSEEDKTTPIGYQITVNLFPPPVAAIGDYMVDADFLDITGNTKHISDYSYPGKYLLLDFWSKGCGPCIMAFPEMTEISETYSENLTIISISFDSDTGWKEALSEHNTPWVNIRDPKAQGGLAASYGFKMMPFYVMISPEGRVVDKWTGFGNGYIKRKVSENVK